MSSSPDLPAPQITSPSQPRILVVAEQREAAFRQEVRQRVAAIAPRAIVHDRSGGAFQQADKSNLIVAHYPAPALLYSNATLEELKGLRTRSREVLMFFERISSLDRAKIQTLQQSGIHSFTPDSNGKFDFSKLEEALRKL